MSSMSRALRIRAEDVICVWPYQAKLSKSRRRIPSSALVDVVGVRRHVDLGLLEDDKPQPGDWVLIHVGYAMSKISEQDAAGTDAHPRNARRTRCRYCRRFAATDWRRLKAKPVT